MGNNTDIKIFSLLLVLTVVLRFFSFFPSVIDHDESTYLVIAKEMFEGKSLYVDLIDIKPVGIFILTGLILKVTGNSIFLFRLFVAVIISFTAFFIYRIKINTHKNKSTALASAMIYIIMVSIFSYFGGSVNTEHFFSFFIILGLLFFLKNKKLVNFFLAGLVLGLGFNIKIVVLFDTLAFSLFLMIRAMYEKENFRVWFSKLIFLGIGFMIPFGLVNLYYLMNGHFEEFSYVNYEVFRNYPSERSIWYTMYFILHFHFRFLPVTFFFYYSLFDKSVPNEGFKYERLFIVLWCSLVLFVILITGKNYGHYFIHLMLPMSFYAGNFFNPSRQIPRFLNWIRIRPYNYIVLIIFIVIILYYHKRDYYDKKDYPREVASWLSERIEDDEILYTGNYEQIIYFLLDKSSPTKYVHKSLITNEAHTSALQIETDEEIRKILSQQPTYILMKDVHECDILNCALENEYRVIKTFNDNIHIYKRNDI